MASAASDERPLALIVLAAGKGTRLATTEDAPPKVLVSCLGAPLLEHVYRAVAPLQAATTVVVTGHQSERVDTWLDASWPGVVKVLQQPQNGTGHALRLALDAIPAFEGDVLVVYGDVPQILTSDLEGLLRAHREAGAHASLLTGIVQDAGSLGRIVRDAEGRFEAIVEAKDAVGRPDILAIGEFNTGIYAFRSEAVRPAVVDLSRDNAQGEEYATDALTRIAAQAPVVAVPSDDPHSLMGVNTLVDLADTTSVIRRRITSQLMADGVTIVDPDTTIIELDVHIERGARVEPFSYIQRGCRVAAGAVVGPFARLRGGATLEAKAEVGNFVEVKKSVLGAGAKAKHLAYLGDATVGAKANVGCGTITANYDGTSKHRTEIGASARIGSGTVLVAPVSIGEGAVTGANSTVLAGRDVPPGSTAVGVPARVLESSRNEDQANAQEGSAD